MAKSKPQVGLILTTTLLLVTTHKGEPFCVRPLINQSVKSDTLDNERAGIMEAIANMPKFKKGDYNTQILGIVIDQATGAIINVEQLHKGIPTDYNNLDGLQKYVIGVALARTKAHADSKGIALTYDIPGYVAVTEV